MGGKFLQVIVGAGLTDYFENSIRACLEVQPHDILGIYNFLDDQDAKRFETISTKFDNSRLTLISRPNDPTNLRVGGLYGAYNLAMQISAEKYEFVNIMQSDMQLMLWDRNVEAEIESMFSYSNDKSRRIVCISTAFPCRGKFLAPQYDSMLVSERSLPFQYTNSGMADVGVWSSKEFARSDLAFLGTEGTMQSELSARGFILPVLSTPIVAFVPWPAVVRRGKIRGRQSNIDLAERRLLVLRKEPPNEQGSAVPWMENSVFPNGWTTLFPYWPTAIDQLKWLQRRADACFELGIPHSSSVGSSGALASSWKALWDRNFLPRPEFVLTEVLRAAVLLLWATAIKLFTFKKPAWTHRPETPRTDPTRTEPSI